MSDSGLCPECQKRQDETSKSLDGLTLIEQGEKESLDRIQAGNWRRTSAYQCEICTARWNVNESVTGALFEYEAIFDLADLG